MLVVPEVERSAVGVAEAGMDKRRDEAREKRTAANLKVNCTSKVFCLTFGCSS